MDPVLAYLEKSKTVPTLRAYIALNYCFDGHETVADLERAELAEDLAEIANMVRDGELIDEHDEFGENAELLEGLWQQ